MRTFRGLWAAFGPFVNGDVSFNKYVYLHNDSMLFIVDVVSMLFVIDIFGNSTAPVLPTFVL